MDLLRHLREGSLEAAATELASKIKAEPMRLEHRYGLACILALRGEFDRAETHLETIGAQDAGTLPGVQLYRSLLRCEKERSRVWKGVGVPRVAEGSDAFVRARATLPAASAKLDQVTLQAVFGELDSEPGVLARVDGAETAVLRDSDDFLGPVLEVFASDAYLWQPMRGLRSLRIQAPTTLVDLIWARAELVTTTGQSASVHMPVLYAGSASSKDALVRTGQKTEWTAVGELGCRAFGGRVLVHGDRELGILEVREIEFAASSAP